MAKPFYRDIQVIKFCRICQVDFRPRLGTVHFGLCHTHRPQGYREFYRKYYRPWYLKNSDRVKPLQYKIWRRWVAANLTKRRGQALASYHRHKDEHRTRRHRRTHSPVEVEVDNASSSSSIA